MSRKKLLLVAETTGYQTRRFAEVAARAGAEVQLATDRCHVIDDPWADGAVALRFENPEDSAAAAARETRCDGVVAVGDCPSYIAALIAEAWGAPFHPPAAVARCRNKHAMRECFRDAGLPVPPYFRVAVDDDPREPSRRAPYPCVLKPLGLSASRGVIRANGENEFRAAFQRIRALLDEPEIRRLHDPEDRFVQVEGFIEGRELALEGLVTGGRLATLALFDKPDPLDGPFFEETIYVTPSREAAATQAAIAETAQSAIEALGLRHGPVHAEVRVNARGVWMLEVAARPIGGLCAKALRFGDGAPLEELIARHALGEDVSGLRREPAASGVMMIPVPRDGVFVEARGVEEALRVEGVEEVAITAKPGHRLRPLPEGSSYLGFIFARAAAPGDVESALRMGHRRLEIEMAATLPVVG
jgi:biotin carboxylase